MTCLRVLISIFTITFIIHMGVEATMCYICSSYLNIMCRDPFDGFSVLRPTDCKSGLIENINVNISFTDMMESEDEKGLGPDSIPRPTLKPPKPKPKPKPKPSSKSRDDMEQNIAILEWTPSLTESEDEMARTKRKKTRHPEAGWSCYRITYAGKLREEVFRGCTDMKTQEQFCSSKYDINPKKRERIKECEMCQNENLTDPDSPPCNAFVVGASRPHDASFPVFLLCLVVVFVVVMQS